MTPLYAGLLQAFACLESCEAACYTLASTNDTHTICPGRRS
jgi:hypothetical protein